MFPQRLDSTLAYDIAKALMDGFNRHYRLFRTESARAKHRFETADWHAQQRAQRERIEFYDLRVPTSWSTWKCPRPMCSSCAA
jgi:isocitrate dehydrogenase kinase/phosphatase